MSNLTPKKSGPLQQSTAATPGRRVYEVYRQGFLLKAHSGVRKTLKRYWFVLFEQKDLLAFLSFADEDHYLEKKKNEGFFRIDDATSIDVLPGYMGRKNAFCITTPRNKYYLVSESRYELHHWLLALHEAMDKYKQHTLQRKKRQRSSSTSGGDNTTVAVGGASTNIGKTPPRIKPSRPAPPVPQGKRKENEPPNMIPPHEGHMQELVSPLHGMSSPTTSPLDAIVAGLLAESNEMGEVEYNMNEEDEGENGDETTVNHGFHPPEDEISNLAPSKNGATSTSMPVLNNVGGDGSKEGTESPENFSGPSSQDNDQFVSSYDGSGRNTIPMDSRGHHQQKKMSRKRSSTKGMRSVSPPNIPPPPPPDSLSSAGQKEGEEVLTDFGDALNEMKSELQSKIASGGIQNPKPLPPLRTSSLATKDPKTSSEGDTSVKSYLDEAFQEEDSKEYQSEDEEHLAAKMKTHPEGMPQGILKKGHDGKRNVGFKDNKRNTPSYEPRIDREDRPLSVIEAKKKLFGDKETKVALYRRSFSQDEDKKEDVGNETSVVVQSSPGGSQGLDDQTDELLRSIENALESTSYMEEKPAGDKRRTPPPIPNQAEGRKSFSVMVGEDKSSPIPPPSLPPPVRHTASLEEENNQAAAFTEQAQPNGVSQTWSATATNGNLNPDQNPVYRSLV